MTFAVDGESLPMLLDTGATVGLTPEAASALGAEHAEIGTSLIVAPRLEGKTSCHLDPGAWGHSWLPDAQGARRSTKARAVR